jgi:hypothetical protein
MELPFWGGILSIEKSTLSLYVVKAILHWNSFRACRRIGTIIVDGDRRIHAMIPKQPIFSGPDNAYRKETTGGTNDT